jgi:hypothetical protein
MGLSLARLVALAFCALGVGALFAPKPSSRGYGLPSDDPTALALIRAMGARDLALGLVVAALARKESRAGLTSTIAVSALVAAADFSLVVPNETVEAQRALVLHGSGVAGLLFIWALLRSGR